MVFRTEANGGQIKPPKYDQQYTMQEAVELWRCKHDCVYFLENYGKIIHPTKGKIPFKLYDYQKKMIHNYLLYQRCISTVARQSGKALALNTPIPTPTGWTTMGDIKVGDLVLGANGKPTKVSFATEVMYNHDCYEVEFFNGEKIIADAEHMWQIQSSTFKDSKVVTTEQIVSLLETAHRGKQSIYIPTCEPLQFTDAKLPIEPYTLGVWLGDGDTYSGQICGHKDDLPEVSSHIIGEGYQLKGSRKDKRNNVLYHNHFLAKDLRAAGLLKNKHIPPCYLRASMAQRLSLLQGLMDTDGSADLKGGLEFYQKNKPLFDQVCELVSSLGMKYKVRSKIINDQTYWTASFSTTRLPVFRLQRKLNIQNQFFGHEKTHRHSIKTITKVDSVPVRCIQVDNEEHMFLCGKSMIPTHNTQVTAGFLLWWAMFKDDQMVLVLSKQGDNAKDVVSRIKNMYLECPWFLKCGLEVDNVFEMKFDNGSRIVSQATTPNSGRGFSISLLMMDELAFVDDSISRPMWTSLIPTVPPDGKIIITSTPNTDEDKFAQVWFNAIDAENSYEWTNGIEDKIGLVKKIRPKNNVTKFETPTAKEGYDLINNRFKMNDKDDDATLDGFRRFFVHWREHPDRDDKFKKKMLTEITMSEWLREYECQFITQDPTLIDSMTINKLGYYVNDPILVDKHGMLWFEDIEPNQVYTVVLDPGEGVEGDNACLQVWAVPQMIQVAEWASNTYDQIEQTKMLIRVLKMIDRYQQAQDAHNGETLLYYSVECNGVGMGVINLLLAEEENIDIPGLLIDSDGNKSRGIRTTAPSKRDYCLRLKTLVERNVFTPNSRFLNSELKTFIKRGKSFEAKPGTKDDRVMACVTMLHMLDEIQYYEEGLEDVLNLKNVASGEFYEDYGDGDYEPPLPMVS